MPCGVCDRASPAEFGDGQVPPRQLGLDAAGEAAVRRHQRGGAVRRIDGAAHDEGDGGRFQSLIGSSDQPHPGDAGGDLVALLVDHLPPAVGGCGRPHGLAEHEAHEAAAAVRIDSRQKLDGGPLDTQPFEQKLEAELGVLRRKRCPGVLVKRLIEPRQHHRAIVEPGNRRHHPRGCRHRTGRAGGDRRGPGASAETLSLAIDDERAALVRPDACRAPRGASDSRPGHDRGSRAHRADDRPSRRGTARPDCRAGCSRCRRN